MSDVRATRARISGPCRSMRAERVSPPCRRGATSPVARHLRTSLTAVEAATPNRSAAARQLAPAATHFTSRSRRSFERGLVMRAGLRSSTHVESVFAHLGNPPRFRQVGFCSSVRPRLAAGRCAKGGRRIPFHVCPSHPPRPLPSSVRFQHVRNAPFERRQRISAGNPRRSIASGTRSGLDHALLLSFGK